ncbi:MAG: sigma-70 family RNA polymerase sigma factor [Clostridia bacterium]|nr:sigma-70 family RNA polymerase sigma factor [Clostridia bacterium]
MMEIKEMLFDCTNDDFKRIVDSYKLLLYSIVYAASAHADADDIVQETFIYAYYHWGMLREKEKLSSWLCTIAKNKAARAMKTAGKTISLDDIEKRVSVTSPETTFLRQERQQEIREKIGELPEKYRDTIVLHYFAEMSISEIAEFLEISESNVKFRLYEGRKKLKKELLYLMDEEKNQVKEKKIWENIESELQRAVEAYIDSQRGDANAICDVLLERFSEIDPHTLSKEELRLMVEVYIQKYLTNMHLEPRSKNIMYLKKCVEIAEISKDERLIQECYSHYAGKLCGLSKHTEAIEYYEKALAIAEKLKDFPVIADLSYWIGAAYVNTTDAHRDIFKAKAYFEKAVADKDELMKSNYGKCIYALAYSAFIAMSRVKNFDTLDGFHSTSPNIIKTERGLKRQIHQGFHAENNKTYLMFDVIAHIAHIAPFLSNDIHEGYQFETNTFTRSKIPVRSRYEVISMNERVETPADVFDDCLHIRYTDQTEDEINFNHVGVRDLFYAPNVGLVQVHFKALNDWEYSVKLMKYEVTPVENGDLCDRYLPLTVGNVWYYDPHRADGTRFNKTDYENRFEVVAERKNDAVMNRWLPMQNIEDKGENDIVTSIAHSGWICKK